MNAERQPETEQLFPVLVFCFALLGLVTLIGLLFGFVEMEFPPIPEIQELNDFCESKGLSFTEELSEYSYGSCVKLENEKITEQYLIIKINKKYVLKDIEGLENV